jgi:membrane protein
MRVRLALRRFWQEIVRSVSNIVRHLLRADVPGHASSMAFSFFLSIIPLLVIVGYALGLVLRRQGIDLFLAPLTPAIPKEVRPLLVHELTMLSEANALPAPLVAIGFLWAASSGVQGFLDGVESILELPRRAFWRKRLAAIACTLCVTLLLPIVGYLLLKLRSVLSGIVFVPLLTLILLVLGSSALAGLYSFASRGYGWSRVWRGSIFAVLCWLFVSYGFTAYARRLGNYHAYYGSLAAVAVLLLWCWLSAFVLLIGAAVNRELSLRKRASDQLRGVTESPPA